MIKVLFETALTDVSSTDIEGVGTLQYGSGGEAYRWVRNLSTTTAIVALQPVCYDETTVGTIAFTQAVSEPETESLMCLAGIAMTAMAASAASALKYGWVQVRGYKNGVLHQNASTAIGVGDSLIAMNDSNYLNFSTADGTAPLYSNTIIALEITATTSAATEYSKDVYIKCL